MSHIEELMQKELGSLPFFALNEKSERSLEKVCVEANYTQEQVDEVAKYGIDVVTLVAANLAKASRQAAVDNFKSRFREGKLVTQMKQNAIVGGQVIAILHSDPLFVPFEGITHEPFVQPYGQYGDTLVYFDPGVPYGTTHVYTWDGEGSVSVAVSCEEKTDPHNLTTLTASLWIGESEAFEPCVMNFPV